MSYKSDSLPVYLYSKISYIQTRSATPDTKKKIEKFQYRASNNHILSRGDTPAYVINGNPLFYMYKIKSNSVPVLTTKKIK